MKRLYHVISGLAGGVLLLAGCEGDTIVLDADPVAPEATTLSVTSDNPLYSAQEGRGTLRFKTPGGEVVFSVETNAETWSYTNDNEAWLAVEQNEYDGTLTLRVQRNEEASEPAAEVVVTAGEGSGARTWTVEVVQNAAGTPEIVATPNRVLIPACGSLLSASTEIACNYEDWEFTQSCDWMLVERRQDKLVFTADENTSSESRQVEVKLTAGYGDRSISETVVVEQDGRAFVRALPEALSFDYRGGTKTIAVSSNFEWNHAADAKWFAVTRENDVLTVTVDPYDGEQGRTENISLTTGVGENTASLEVAITQMGVNDKYLRWKFEIPSDNATATAMIAGEVDAEINWGDGTVETVTTANPTHVYATAGSYDVEVSGKVTALKSAGEKSYVVEVLQWGQTGLTSMEDAFNGCMNLKSIPSDTAHSFDGVTTFNEAFYDCQTLGAIPAGLFDNATRATDFTSTFHFCHSIPEIPEKLFYYNTEATSFSQTFYYVGSQVNKEAEGLLTEIPAGLFETNTKAQTFLSVFGHTAIRSVPATLFQNCPNVTVMTSLFDSCKALEIVPADLFGGCPAVTSFSQVFRMCTALKSIPELIFFNNTLVTTFKGAFSGAGIETIPAGLFARQFGVNSCSAVFQDCPIGSIPRGLFSTMTKCTDFSQAFKGCTKLTSIPSDLLASCPDVSNVASIFSECASIASIPSGLFGHTTSIKNGNNLFEGCSSLRTLPDDLFATFSATGNFTFTSTFEGCTSLQSLPSGLFATVAATGFANTFTDCTGLTSLPDDLFAGQTKIKTFSNTFNGCTGLESLPEGLFAECAAMTSVSSAFIDCTGLKSLPAGLFAKNAELATITSVFSGCTGLTSIPAGLFDNNKKIKTAKTAFKNCSALTGESPFTQIDGRKIHLYERTAALGFTAVTNTNATDCFAGCTGLSDYDAMPTAWK